jgi:zinc transport system substrate-binding protein
MDRRWISGAMLTSLVAVSGFGLTSCGTTTPPTSGGTRILCSTFPVYLITRNVTKDRENAHVSLMLPAQLGCPHDYALTPDDMQKLAQSDVLVVNGLGLEEFLGAPIQKANPKIAIIDSSKDLQTTMEYAHSAPESGLSHEHHQHSGVNPHVFASPRLVAVMADTIAEELAKFDPAGGEIYRRNAKAYAVRIDTVADELAEVGRRLKNNRIVAQHGAFDYLARDMGLEVVALLQAHAGQEPSAAEMIEIVKTIREKHAGAVFTEPQYPSKIGETIAREAGVAVATLDPVATGPENAGLDYYETTMRENRKTLATVLGTK